jgi:glycosyltransferase involved in cell wall biosynthesis
MKKILVFTPYYYPGFLSGGIARSVLNTVSWLKKDFIFFIVTKDVDLNSKKSYSGVKYGKWMLVGGAKVLYLAPNEVSFSHLTKLINEIDFDVLHLNSFFDSFFTIRILILRRLGFISPKKVLLSPRGELVEGPLRFKAFKKKAFIFFSKLAGFYKNVIWHSSSPNESIGITLQIGVLQNEIKVALDLPICNPILPKIKKRDSNTLRVVFISRLTREKNLDGALKILRAVKCRVDFDIIGPKEDSTYWGECDLLIKRLPANIVARVFRPIKPNDIFKRLSNYDLLLFPTHGENYGHVIAESISVGTRVLISKFTPWRNLSSDGVGWDLDNSNSKAFVSVIEKLANQSPHLRDTIRPKIIEAARIRLSDPKVLRQNYNLFSVI